MSNSEAPREVGMQIVRSMWMNLLEKKSVMDVTKAEQRALELREICLSAAGIANRVLRDPGVNGNPLDEADMINTFKDCVLNLKELGITERRTEKSSGDLLSIAEDACRLWIGIEYQQIPSARGEILRLQESNQSVRIDKQSTADAIRGIYDMKFSNEWMEMSGIVSLTHQLLGIESESVRKYKEDHH